MVLTCTNEKAFRVSEWSCGLMGVQNFLEVHCYLSLCEQLATDALHQMLYHQLGAGGHTERTLT